MYIKQIIIQGFKSYKTQTVIEPFSDKTNVIVGRNGSGKSNFFAAMRFVLSDAYTQMSREERQGLLHEGSGSAVTSAYVEIIFDNSDYRIISPNKEVILRRTISLHKDEYSVDRKVVTKADVLALLEGAGFSRSNPYYIVPQGRVTALTNMKESDRLNLLKEVAGTQVYEARRAESLKIMQDTENKREKIDELLKDVESRLAELEEEKEELKGYQTREKEKRCLEYAYYYQEQERLQDALEEIDSLRQVNGNEGEAERAQLAASEAAIASLDERMHGLHRDLDLLEINRRQYNEDRLEAAKAQAQAELKSKSLSDNQAATKQSKAEREAEYEATLAALEEKKAELAKVVPDFNKKKLKEDEIKKNLDAADAARSRLFTKQSHGTRFKSKKERDDNLRKETEEVGLDLSNQKANKIDAEEDIKSKAQQIKAIEKEIATLRDQLQNWGGSRTRLAQEATRAKDHLDSLVEARKQLRRDEEKLDSLVSNARNEKVTAEERVHKLMDTQTARGLATIRRLKAERDIPGAFGTIAELIEVDGPYQLPVEQAAGGSLFHYVVDNADTATELTKALYDLRGGRITFMPLRELQARGAVFPRGDDAIPMIEKINYDGQFEKAVRHVFGRTVICPNLSVANQYARSHGLTAITLEGDTASKRGAISGGFIDSKKSRLQAVKQAGRWADEFDKFATRAKELRRKIEKKDQEVTDAAGESRKLEQALDREKSGFYPLQEQLANMLAQLDAAKDSLHENMRRRDEIEKNMRDFAETIEAAEAEMASEFKKSLTAGEGRQMEELGVRVQQLKKQWNETANARRLLETRKSSLEIEINKHLQRKLDELTSQAAEDVASSGSADSVQDAKRELKKLQKAAAATIARFEEAAQQLEAAQKEIAQLEADKAARLEDQRDLAVRVEAVQRKMEKKLEKKSFYMTRAAELAKNIRDLGVLPEEAFSKYQKMEMKNINKKLKKVNEELKKFKHVNKKAFEQYNSFTTQQEQLLDRRRDLEASQDSINELIQHLDARKDEAIERTFKQVSRDFATIFEKLVPAGHGRLVISRRADKHQQRQQPEDEESDQDAPRGGTIENYTGVGISVSFNSKTMDEQQKIQQLSGGQKSLCALCLIFALQQAESSPMVIFDEVDANLDAQYRTAVASLLQSISAEAGTQFICTTFRPEIVHVADKCYGVTFHDKTSSIDCVPTEDALNFVEGQAKGT